jgi:pimeloyl-ACP methyl ester carboxylesterase
MNARPDRWWTRYAAAATAALAAGLPSAALASPARIPAPATAPDGRLDPRLARFHTQRIAWHGCRLDEQDEIGKELDAVGARCAELSVPVDYRDPNGRTALVAIARRPAGDRAGRLGTLMVNTGGPGESRSGLTWIVSGLPPFVAGSPVLAERFDLVAMDPRFMGRSTPLPCDWPRGLGVRAMFVGAERASFTRSTALNRDIATRCAGQRDLLPHVSSRNIARDLDVVRAALGERRVSWLGWSYGGYLGAVYRQMFPHRLDRVVLDSTPDPAGYPVNRGNAPALAAEQRNWAAWAARRHDEYGLGTTTEQVLAAMDAVRRVADRGRPVRIGRHTVDLNAVRSLGLGIDSESAYGLWSGLMRVFYDAARGIAVTPTPEQEQLLAEPSAADVDPEAAGRQASYCADRTVSRDPEAYFRDIRAHRAAEPFFGPPTRNLTPCAFWPARSAEPSTAVGNPHPALLIGATGDPTTPYAGQQALHRVLTGSRMLTLRGAYRHGVVFLEGNPCVDDVANRYLLTGVLPGADVTCARNSPYASGRRIGGAGAVW